MSADPVKQAAKRLARLYGKRSGAMTASGMAAVELALELCGVGPGDEVIVPQETCFRVPSAAVRLGAWPVFAATRRHLIDPRRLDEALSSRTRAVIAVHHYGLPCPMRDIRDVLPKGLPLIEDAAQAFDLAAQGDALGRWSDYVISSFSASKPLSLDGGGGVFGDADGLADAMDGYGTARREADRPPRPYPLHPSAVTDIQSAIERAESLVARRRAAEARLRPALEAAGLKPWQPCGQDAPCWQRLPLEPQSTAAREAALRPPEAVHAVEPPHTIALINLPLFAGARRITAATATSSLFLRIDETAAVEAWIEALETNWARSTV